MGGTLCRWGRMAALLAMAAAYAAGAQQGHDPSGHYSAPKAGEPLCTLKIHVTGFRSEKGLAGGAVYRSPDGWPEDTKKSVVHGGFPIEGRQATEIFRVPPGRYAVVAIHDANENHKLDRNFFGIPKEGFGFANNPRVLLSAPSFQAAAVNVSCPVTEIGVKLIYK